MNTSGWNAENVGKLTQLWLKSASPRSIGEELGKSRNAIISKAKRLALYGRALKAVKSNSRVGQAQFRRNILDAYNKTCCISRINEPEVLEAAHIHPYSIPNDNHVNNGICLRTDIHRLFDCGLITIRPDCTVKISETLTDPEYTIFEKSVIQVPADFINRPSSIHFDWHNKNIFRVALKEI